MKINITGLDRAEVLLALYNNAMFKGAKFSSKPELSKKMAERPLATLEDAEQEIEMRKMSGDYLFNAVGLGSSVKVLGVDLSGSEFDSSEYDSNHGVGLAEKVISDLRNAKKEAKSEVKPSIDDKGNFILARNIKNNEKFKTDHVGTCIIKGNVGKGAEIDCRKSELIITGDRSSDVTLHCLGEPTILGKKGNNVTIYSYDKKGKCTVSRIGIDGDYVVGAGSFGHVSKSFFSSQSALNEPAVEVKSNEPSSAVSPVSPVSPISPISPISKPKNSPSSSRLFGSSVVGVGGSITAAPGAKVNVQVQSLDMTMLQRLMGRFGR